MKDLSMAVVIKDGKVLVQERFRHNKGMVFEFPGGSIDQGETPEQAAIRELCEETGLKELKLVGSHQAHNELGNQIHFVIFIAQSNVEPQVTNPKRQQTFHWLKPGEIPKKDFYKADLDFIESQLESYTRKALTNA